MGVYGNIHGAFNGLGKPSIKLEFEDNEALVAFSKKMQEDEPAPVEWNEEEGMFTSVEGVDYEKMLDYYAEPFRRVNFNIWSINKDFQDVIKDKNGTLVFIVKTPLKYIYLRDAQFKKLKDNKREAYFGLIKPTLTDPVLIVDDKGSDVYVKSFYNVKGDRILCFCSVSDNSDDLVRSNHEKRKAQILKRIKAGSVVKYLKGDSHVAYGINGTTHAEPLLIVDFPLFDCKDEINISDRQIFNENSLGAPGDTYIVTDNRKKAKKDPGDLKALKDFYFDKPTGVKFLKSNGDFDFKTPLTDDGTYSFVELKDRYDDRWQDILNDYLHSKYGNLVGRREIKPLLEKDKYWQQLKAAYKKDKEFVESLGKTANPLIYNNNDIIECRGLVPTYQQLDDYTPFFGPAKTHTDFAGFGLDDTLKLISDICRRHYRDCAKIAQHLKGDCKLQSAFNLWHWMRYNIRYEYDREGREEVRTPRRVWADRHRGVDCDCLSVFAWCVLKCMGYDPAFELAAFRNKPAYSHIYINLDGIVIDRVWFIFNSRPPLVTKTELFKVRMLDNLGQLF